MAKTLLDLEKDVKLRARVNKKGVFAYILTKDSHPVPQLYWTYLVKKEANWTSTAKELRLRLNDFVKIHLDSLYWKYQSQVSH